MARYIFFYLLCYGDNFGVRFKMAAILNLFDEKYELGDVKNHKFPILHILPFSDQINTLKNNEKGCHFLEFGG